MSDRPQTYSSPESPDGCASTQSTPVGKREAFAAPDADALPVTRTQATDPHKAEAAAGPPVQKLPTRFGRYRLIRELGRGGMGTVVLAEDTQLGRQVALKIPFLKKASDTRTLKRFEREAKAAAALSHPHICAVYDFGTFQDMHFLSMAYLEGKPLQAFLDSGQRIPQRTAARIIRKIAGALQHAHERGVIHRDLKPSNIMMEPKLGPVVTDFGLARCLDDEGDVQLTQDGVAIGTPSYMSPEQLDSDSSDLGPASDVFSLGLIFFEMLTGQRRFQGKVTSIIGQILTKDPVSLQLIREDIDPLLDEICRKMMARNPADRYGSMAEVAGILRAYHKGQLAEPVPKKVPPEMSSDPDVFFADLETLQQTGSPAPATEGGAELVNTDEEFIPSIVISDEDSKTSHILQKHTRTPLPRKTLVLGVLGIATATGLAGFYVYDALAPDPSAETKAESHDSTKQAAPEQGPPRFQPEDFGLPPEAGPDAITSVENPSAVVWQFTHDKPLAGNPPAPRPAQPKAKPAPSVPEATGPKTASPIQLKPAKGNVEFHAVVDKTINGSNTEKQFKTPRLALPELAKLDRREKDGDRSLKQVRTVVVLNENAFAFQKAHSAHDAVLALEDGIRQNILIEEILAKWKLLNVPQSPPQITLPPQEIERIENQIQLLINTNVQAFVNRLNQGLGPNSQRDIDLAQSFFEQECRKLPGIPKDFPLPKLRVTITPRGAANPNPAQTYIGDSERLKDQTPRGRLIKRIAEALSAGTLVEVAKE